MYPCGFNDILSTLEKTGNGQTTALFWNRSALYFRSQMVYIVL